MVILDVRLKKIYGFDEFHMNFSYPAMKHWKAAAVSAIKRR